MENPRKKDSMKTTLKTILIPIMFALPMLCPIARESTLGVYKALFTAKIPSILEIGDTAFFANAVFTCAAITAIVVYAMIARILCGINTNAKKLFFTAGLIFYIFAQQAVLILILLGINANFDKFQWNILNVWTALLYAITLVSSLWLYRVLVGKNRETLQVVCACLSMLILAAAAFLPVFLPNVEYALYGSFALAAVYIATAADIAFKGLGYKIIAKLTAARR